MLARIVLVTDLECPIDGVMPAQTAAAGRSGARRGGTLTSPEPIWTPRFRVYFLRERYGMVQNAEHLVWVDMEMTGLDPDRDRVIEIALVITDAHLAVVAEAPVLVVHQTDAVLDGMDAWNTATHGKSGLTARVRASTLDEAAAERQMLDFMAAYVGPRLSPMCGNSICQDRRFMARWLPRLEAHFHYRNLDVSTLKELARRWKPEVLAGLVKQGRHEALADIHESIAELRHYREHLLRV